MRDRREQCTRLPARGSPWRAREAELVGGVLWAVGSTTGSCLPDTGCVSPCPRLCFLDWKASLHCSG